MADNYAGLAYALVAGIHDQVREGFAQRSRRELGQTLIQSFVDRADGGCRKAMPAQLFGNGLDLAGRDSLYVHLRQSRHQRALRALIALEQLGRKLPRAILRHPQLQLAYPRDQATPVVARTITVACYRAFALSRAKGVGHFGFQHFLQGCPDQLTQKVLVAPGQRF